MNDLTCKWCGQGPLYPYTREYVEDYREAWVYVKWFVQDAGPWSGLVCASFESGDERLHEPEEADTNKAIKSILRREET